MGYDAKRLAAIFRKTDGHCHICGKKLNRNNYGKATTRAAWEVEHSLPAARGGTDHLNNLFPACIACNRGKQDGSTRTARAGHGRKAAPLSAERKKGIRRRNAVVGAGVGGMGALALGASGPVGLAVAGIGALIGGSKEPDPQKGKRRR